MYFLLMIFFLIRMAQALSPACAVFAVMFLPQVLGE